MAITQQTPTQEQIDTAVDAIEQHEREVASLATRAELACATAALCEAHRSMLRQRHEVEARGDVIDFAACVRMIQECCAAELRAFVAAWCKGTDAVENMRVIEAAVLGYAEQFDLDDDTRAGIERLFLDFMRKAVWRLPAPGSATPIDGDRVGAAMANLEGRLEELLAACMAEGGDPRGPATSAATHGVLVAIGTTLRLGYGLERLQLGLDWWTKAAEAIGAPRLTVEVGGQPPMH
jgi:hypothetical protein